MSDITVIPPIRILPDITIPFLDPIDIEVYLESIGNPMILSTIQALFSNIPISIDLNGDIDVAGVKFSTKFNLCPLICSEGFVKTPLGTCIKIP